MSNIDKVSFYDVASIKVDLDKNIKVSLFDSGKVEKAVERYEDVGARIMLSSPVPFTDSNHDASAINQYACSLAINNSVIEIKAKLAEMKTYSSSAPGQGDAKWVGLLIDTGTDDITKVKYNNALLTSADVTEAALVGGGAGMFVLWIKADVVLTAPKVFSLEINGKKESFVVKVVDMSK